MAKYYLHTVCEVTDDGEILTNYYWSNLNEPPYITGHKGADWDGPFETIDDARKDLTSNLCFDVDEPAPISKDDIPHMFWPVYGLPATLSMQIPLDEFSERAALIKGGKESPERKALFDALKVVIMPTLAESSNIHVWFAWKKRGDFDKIRKLPVGRVWCQIKLNIHISCRNTLDTKAANLKRYREALIPTTVSLNPLYELLRDVQLVINQ